MSQYYFSLVSGVLPDLSDAYSPSRAYCLKSKRTYLSRGCRPHVAWVTDTDAPAEPCLGSYGRLKGDGTSTRDAPTGAAEGHRLKRLLTVDGATGKRVVNITAAPLGAEESNTNTSRVLSRRVITGTAPIPSSLRITSLLPFPSHHLSTQGSADGNGNDPTDDTGTVEHFVVTDARGNLYRLRWAVDKQATLEARPASSAVASAKRPREDGEEDAEKGFAASEAAAFPYAAEAQWDLMVPAASELPSVTCAATYEDGTGDEALSLFQHSRGSAMGFVGTGFVGPAAATQPSLVCVREGYQDVRVMDLAEGARVVRAYSTTHRPTALYIPSAWSPGPSTAAAPLGPLEQTVLVCEGTLATLFDIRCPSAVMTIPQLFQAAPATDAAAGKKDEPASAAPLVPGRLTSILGSVTDACATANPFEVAMSIDRALCVYDFRKFNRLFSSSNVLKYTVATVAATARGRAVVCAGVDSEVRIIPLYPKSACDTEDGAALTLAGSSHAAAVTTAAAAPAGSAAKGGEEEGDDAVEAFSTFRTRLNTSVSCETTWQGAWVTSYNACGAAAVGISLDHEVFLAQ